MAWLFVGGFVVAWLVGVLSWGAIVVYAFKTVRCARPGISIWGRATLWNPFNLLVLPHLLTQDGRLHRKKCFLALVVFVGSVGLGAIIGFATSTK